ncbi:hypothetical protein MVEN_01805800 [Mycena venus]|uniref:Uncharacterized protein n=1 Tax=Mycena venus TaxID=2733690 RepID=A0A8H6XIK1_9AGAR|nr:hypothetical protein MVEN_01805800 [Mycena venus]
MSNVALHPNMYAQRAQESEAKLRHAFTKPVPNSNASFPGAPFPGAPAAAAPLMMRKPQKSKMSGAPAAQAPLMMRQPQKSDTHHTVGGYGPTVYDPSSVATSIIYWPKDRASVPETGSTPEPSAGLEEFKRQNPNGGATFSVHQPTKSLAWLEKNYDLPLLEDMRKEGIFSGPIPMQLFPEISALVIFGPHREPNAAKLAQALANESLLPVITRATTDDPMLKFKTVLATEGNWDGKGMAGGGDPADNGGGGGPSGGRDPADNGGGGGPPGGRDPVDNGGGGGPPGGRDPADNGGGGGPPGGRDPADNGGGGGPPGGGDPAGHGDAAGGDGWASPMHWAHFLVKFKLKRVVGLEISCRTQFTTHTASSKEFNPPEEGRKQAQAVTELKINFEPDYVSLGKSFAVLGLQADRSSAIFDPSNLDAGFNPPNQTFKYVSARNKQASVGLNASIPPTAIFNATYTFSAAKTVEAQDDKPTPLVKVTSKPVLEDEPEGTSYRSYSYSYAAQHPPMGLSSLLVRFAFGVDFWDHDTKDNPAPPPRVLSLNRHQIFIWIHNPQSKIQVQGLILLFSIVVPDIRSEDKIAWSQTLTIDPESGKLLEDPKIDHNRLHGGSAYSGIVALPKAGGHLLGNFIQGTNSIARKLKPTPSPVTLAAEEIASVGWDNHKNDWINPIYLELDKIFLPAEETGSSSVYQIVPFGVGSRLRAQFPRVAQPNIPEPPQNDGNDAKESEPSAFAEAIMNPNMPLPSAPAKHPADTAAADPRATAL